MISKQLLLLMHEAASIQRWNDHIRPWTGFTELDKQAHKMFYAYVLSKCEGEGNYNEFLLAEGGIFEFIHRIILTDIKPPIYHELMAEKGESINKWIFSQVKDSVGCIHGGFYDRMKKYFQDENYAKKEKQILKAAHMLATDWEFKIIYNMNSTTYGIETVKDEIVKSLANCDTFDGFKYFIGSPYLNDFLSLIGKLRYQQRWSRASRMPQTFVMGHMLIVAVVSYLCSAEIGACEERCANNFFSALFHDLPEVLTRDIVSPVKKSVEGLDDIIKGIELKQMKKVIFPLLPKSWHDEVEYFTENEFSSKIKLDGNVNIVSSDEINDKYNDKKFQPIDGEIIRGCDHLSAYIEAYLSLKYGIQSEQLKTGHSNLLEQYENCNIGGVEFGKLFDYFRL